MVREESPDYGVDSSVEIVDSSDEVSGLRFFVQLKATDKPLASGGVRVRLKRDSLTYLARQPGPVLVVLYHAPSQALFARWSFDLDTFFAKSRGDSIEFEMFDEHHLGPENTADLIATVNDWKWLNSNAHDVPVTIRLRLLSDRFRGVAARELLSELDRASSVFAHQITISELPTRRVRGEVVLSAEHIHARMFGGRGAWVHRTNVEARRSGERHLHRTPGRRADGELVQRAKEVAADALIAIALALELAGRTRIAASVALACALDSSVVGDPRSFALLTSAILRERRHVELAIVARELAARGQADTAALLAGAVLVSDPDDGVRDELAATLVQCAEILDANSDGAHVASTLQNVGRFLAVKRDGCRAGLRLMIRASRKDRLYLKRSHYWEEVGACLFELGRFQIASKVYARAIECGGEGSVTAKLGDALLRSGSFVAAGEALRQYVGDSPKWIALRHVVSVVLRVTGTSEQRVGCELAKAMHSEAMTLPVNSKESADGFLNAVRADGTFALAWYNLGVSLSQRGHYVFAAEAFLVAAVLVPNDLDAWVNAFAAVWNAPRPADGVEAEAGYLTYVIVAAGKQVHGEAFFREVAARFGELNADARATLSTLFAETAAPNDAGPVVRFLGEGESTEMRLDAEAVTHDRDAISARPRTAKKK